MRSLFVRLMTRVPMKTLLSRAVMVGAILIGNGLAVGYLQNLEGEIAKLDRQVQILEEAVTLVEAARTADELATAFTFYSLCQTDSAIGLISPLTDCEAETDAFLAQTQAYGESLVPR